MKFPETLQLLAQILSSLCALLLSFWAGMPWWSTGAVAGLFIGLIVTDVFPRPGFGTWALGLGAIGTVLGLGYLLLGTHYWDGFHAAWAGLATLPVLLGCLRWKSRPVVGWWRLLAISWALAADVVWLGSTYQRNDRLGFYVALAVCVAVLILAKGWFRLPTPVIISVNTVILLVVGLPLANLLVSPADSLGIPPPLSAKPYSYEFFKKDPAGYARWLNYFGEQFPHQLYVYQQDGPLAYHLRPNSRGMFCECPISINSNGFRGAEIPADKKDAYRIVVLGESTTFGFTIYADEKPWCELLEKMIQERLKPGRPVEVINGGTPGYGISENLYRLPTQILPLKPDLIISYHGYNGFKLVAHSLPPVVTLKRPPAYERRPLKILADAEYAIEMNRYKKNLIPKTVASMAEPLNSMESGYADAYRQLIEVCHTNNIRLVLSTYSMAVNGQSDPDVIQFYSRFNMELPQLLQANVMHTTIVKSLVESNPGLGFVDTHPGMDGVHEHFIDLLHFTPEGEQQMAETFFAGIKDLLVKELAKAAHSSTGP